MACLICICFNVKDLADYDVIKLIVTFSAILEQMAVTKEFLNVDIDIISKAPAHAELPTFENLRVSQLICTPLQGAIFFDICRYFQGKYFGVDLTKLTPQKSIF